MTLKELIAKRQAELAAVVAQRNAASASLRDAQAADERDDAVIAERRTQVGVFDADIDKRGADLEQLRADLAADEVADERAASIVATEASAPKYDEVARVASEKRTYTRDSSLKGESSFFADAFRAQFTSDFTARDRLERHMSEVRVEGEMSTRAVGTSAFAGLVIPQYLPQEYALALRAGRPFANICNRKPLPADGMSILLQRGTTGAATAVQATENSAVQNTDEVWADLTVPVRTIAGQQQVSRQALERGALLDSVVYEDLARAYAANLDNQLINGTGSSGQILGALNTAGIGAATAFGAAPTVTNFSLKVAGQIATIAAAGAGVYGKAIVMHPRRWGWLTGQVDSTGRPVVQSNSMANFNAVSTIGEAGIYSADKNYFGGAQFVGVHSSGLPVLTDINIPITVGTNVEDVVLVVDTDLHYLWEEGDGMPRQLNFEQTIGGSLTTTLVVYGYAAYTAGKYPAATGKIGGLDSTATFGLVAPSF